MSIRNCPECGKLFEFLFKNLCPDCINKEDGEFEAIVAYLRENPGVGISEISEATGIGVNRIVKMLKSGRLIAVCERHDIVLLTCERCGKPIAEGQFCLQCRGFMSKALNGEIGEAMDYSKHAGVEKHNSGRDARSEVGKSGLFTKHFNK